MGIWIGGMMSELVSVILTTYNNPVGLITSLSNAINQTYKNIEIIVVDGGTNKFTRVAIDILKDKRITYVSLRDTTTNRIGGNVQQCRNLGVTLAKGKYVAMLDDDDMWQHDKIEKQLGYMEMYYPSLIVCQTKKKSGEYTMIDKPPNEPKLHDLLLSFCFSQTSAYFMNKKDLIRCGGFNEKLRSMHEYDVALRMAKMGMRIETVQQPLLNSYCDNATKRKYYFIKIAETLDLYRCYGDDMKKYLNMDQLIYNAVKTFVMLSLYSLGYIIGGHVWRIMFKLKGASQKC